MLSGIFSFLALLVLIGRSISVSFDWTHTGHTSQSHAFALEPDVYERSNGTFDQDLIEQLGQAVLYLLVRAQSSKRSDELHKVQLAVLVRVQEGEEISSDLDIVRVLAVNANGAARQYAYERADRGYTAWQHHRQQQQPSCRTAAAAHVPFESNQIHELIKVDHSIVVRVFVQELIDQLIEFTQTHMEELEGLFGHCKHTIRYVRDRNTDVVRHHTV